MHKASRWSLKPFDVVLCSTVPQTWIDSTNVAPTKTNSICSVKFRATPRHILLQARFRRKQRVGQRQTDICTYKYVFWTCWLTSAVSCGGKKGTWHAHSPFCTLCATSTQIVSCAQEDSSANRTSVREMVVGIRVEDMPCSEKVAFAYQQPLQPLRSVGSAPDIFPPRTMPYYSILY